MRFIQTFSDSLPPFSISESRENQFALLSLALSGADTPIPTPPIQDQYTK